MKNLIENKILYDIEDIKKILKISSSTAYRVINELNVELKNKKNKYGNNYHIFGSKIYSKYFKERYYDIKFLKINEIKEKLNIKDYEARELSLKIKLEIKEKGYLYIRGRIPEKYLMEKIEIY